MRAPTTAECDALRTKLAEAEEALHQRSIGSREKSMRMGENGVEWADTDPATMRAYIADLKAKLGRCDGCGGSRLIGVIPH